MIWNTDARTIGERSRGLLGLPPYRSGELPLLRSGTCEDHAKEKPYILELFQGRETKALVVEDAIYCGRCRVRPDPIPLPELDG